MTEWFDVSPAEILLNIFQLLPDARTTLKCRLLNKRCRECIDSCSRLQYTIKLDAWGYEDLGASTSYRSLVDRKNKLEDHVNVWNSLDWTREDITIPKPAAYNLFQGVWISVNRSLPNTITCVEFPSRVWPHTSTTRHQSFSYPIRDLVIDPSQDLLILLELWVWSRALMISGPRLTS